MESHGDRSMQMLAGCVLFLLLVVLPLCAWLWPLSAIVSCVAVALVVAAIAIAWFDGLTF